MNRIVNALGLSLAFIAGGYFVAHAYRALAGEDLSALLDTRTLAALALLTCLYSATILTNAAAWCRQLRAMGQPHGYHRFLAILASAQFGKYLPGNIGHHLGRVTLAKQSGVGLVAAALSIGYELLIAVMLSAHIAAFALLLTPSRFLLGTEYLQYRWLLLGLVFIGTPIGLILAPKIATWLTSDRTANPTNKTTGDTLALDFRTIVFSYLMYGSGMAAIGIGLWTVAQTLAGDTEIPGPLFFIGGFTASWILGLAAPGAPAGLGVREAVLSLWLSQSLPAAAVVLLVIALRVSTTIGDLLNFGWGSAMLFRQSKLPSA